MAGRPTKYTPKLGTEIYELIVEGKTIREICDLPRMPCMSTVFKWKLENAAFSDLYTRAREIQTDIFADDIVSIARTPVQAIRTKTGISAKGTPIDEEITYDAVDRARLHIDALKWRAAKANPNKYGDRTTIAGDRENPIVTEEVSTADRSVLRHFIEHHARRAAMTPEQIEAGEDLV